jgi:cell division protein FtsL
MSQKETQGHIALANAKETEEHHLATVNEQYAEWSLTISQAQEKIRSYQDAIEGQKTLIQDAKREQMKLRKKRRIFQTASFQLGLVDQE